MTSLVFRHLRRRDLYLRENDRTLPSHGPTGGADHRGDVPRDHPGMRQQVLGPRVRVSCLFHRLRWPEMFQDGSEHTGTQ